MLGDQGSRPPLGTETQDEQAGSPQDQRPWPPGPWVSQSFWLYSGLLPSPEHITTQAFQASSSQSVQEYLASEKPLSPNHKWPAFTALSRQASDRRLSPQCT